MTLKTLTKRQRIKNRIRSKISGTAKKPRLSVYKSNKYMYAQAIDDVAGNTIVAANSANKEGTFVERSFQTGKDIAIKLKNAGIAEIVFDRNGFQYTGRVKALADALREEGIKF